MKKLIKYLDFGGTGDIPAIKDIDEKRLIVTGYFGAFNNVDLGGDILEPFSANRTIIERGPKGSNDIFFLRQHDTNSLLGKPKVLKADEYGIYHESPISDTTLGKDTAILIRDGVLNKFSIGYRVVQEQHINGVNHLKEIHLYEGSVVTFPMNENAILTGVKNKSVEDVQAEFTELEKYIRKTTVSDDGIKLLLLKLRQLQQVIIDLTKPIDPPKGIHPGREKEIAEKIKLFTKKLVQNG